MATLGDSYEDEEYEDDEPSIEENAQENDGHKNGINNAHAPANTPNKSKTSGEKTATTATKHGIDKASSAGRAGPLPLLGSGSVMSPQGYPPLAPKRKKTSMSAKPSTSASPRHQSSRNSSSLTPNSPRAPPQTAWDIESSYQRETSRLKQELKGAKTALVAIRTENETLKKIDKRYQRELEEIGERQQCQPDVVERLQAELSSQKKKLKEQLAKNTQTERRLRAASEALEALKEENLSLTQLVDEKDLRHRAELEKQISQAQEHLKANESDKQELEKKIELVEKNYGAENQRFRAKTASLDKECHLLNERITLLDNKLKEKEREIASLFIYKYNALHRRPEPCAKCQERSAADSEVERLKSIQKMLPQLAKPRGKILDGGMINLIVELPTSVDDEQSEGLSYDRVEVYASTKEHMSEPVIQCFEANGQPEEIVLIENFPIGEFCFLAVAACYGSVKGPVSPYETIMVDLLPSRPCAPNAKCIHEDGGYSMKVTVSENSEVSGGTPVHLFRIYHALYSPTRFHLISEIPAPTLHPCTAVFTMRNPEVAVAHYFSVAAVNRAGESEHSKSSASCVLDFAPRAPNAPTVRRHGTRSVLVSVEPALSAGESSLERFIVRCYTVRANTARNEVSRKVIIEAARKSPQIVIDDLELGVEYKFSAAAENKIGASPESNLSDPISLEKMLPTPPAPRCVIMSSTKVKCYISALGFFDDAIASTSAGVPSQLNSSFSSTNSSGSSAKSSTNNSYLVKSDASAQPELSGSKLWMATKADLSDIHVVCHFIPFHRDRAAEHVLDALEIGGSYWFAVSNISMTQESALSDSVGVCLALAIPLPRSPSEHVIKEVAAASDELSNLPAMNRLSRSRSIDLSSGQRVSNMHRGNPAYSVPPEVKSRYEQEGTHVMVNIPGASRDSKDANGSGCSTSNQRLSLRRLSESSESVHVVAPRHSAIRDRVSNVCSPKSSGSVYNIAQAAGAAALAAQTGMSPALSATSTATTVAGTVVPEKTVRRGSGGTSRNRGAGGAGAVAGGGRTIARSSLAHK